MKKERKPVRRQDLKGQKRWRLTRDVLIPAGTELMLDPPHTVTYATATVLYLEAVTKDTTSYWMMDAGDARDAGLIEEVPDGGAD